MEGSQGTRVWGCVWGQIWKTLKDMWGCWDFILRATETKEGPEAQGESQALKVQGNKDSDTEKDRSLRGYCRNLGKKVEGLAREK